MAFSGDTELTPAESTRHDWEAEELRLAREHDLAKTRLQLEAQKDIDLTEIELKRLEARWDSWIALPRYLLKLPVLLLFGIGYLIHAIRKTKPSQEFWDFIRK